MSDFLPPLDSRDTVSPTDAPDLVLGDSFLALAVALVLVLALAFRLAVSSLPLVLVLVLGRAGVPYMVETQPSG